MNLAPGALSEGEQASNRSWNSHPSITSALSYAILLGGMATVIVAAHLVVVSYSPLPFSDGWEAIFATARGVDLVSWNWLWEQHNEHRLLIPKLFEIVDLRWFQGRQVFLLASVFAIQLLHLALLVWSMRALGGWRGPALRTGAGITAFCLFCPSQWENLVWGFQLCFVLPGLFASLSFVALLLYWMKSKEQPAAYVWPRLALSVVAALGANWSLSNGMLLWPLLLIASLLLQLRRSAVIALTTTGIASCGLYFHHYVRPLESADLLTSLRSPSAILQYVATYLGSAWITKNIGAAMLWGSIGLIFAILLMARMGRNIRTFKPFAVQLVLILTFCLGTAFLTAIGRVNLGLGQAMASRYQSVVLLFWLSSGLLSLQRVLEAGPSRTTMLRIQVVLIAVMLRGAALARQPLHEARSHGFVLDTASVALLTGVDDTAALREIYPRPDAVWRVLPYLRTHELSIFAGSIPHQLGKPVDAVFRIAPANDCMGSWDSRTQMDQAGSTAVKISGWAWDVQHRRPATAVVAVNLGVITGWAAVGAWRPSVRAANPGLTTSYVGFTGYAGELHDPSPVELYAVLGGNPESACPLAATAPVDQR